MDGSVASSDSRSSLLAFIETDEFTKLTSNVTRLATKLKSAISRGESYETQQLLQVICFRLINNRDKIESLQELLYRGAYHLLSAREFVSGQDVATLYLDAAAKCLQKHRDEINDFNNSNLANPSIQYHASKLTIDWNIGKKVAVLTVHMPETEVGQSKFVAESLRLLNPKLLNRSLLHNLLAKEFWEFKRDFVNSRYHYLHCASLENGSDIANLLVDYQIRSASNHEIDLFITQFILQYLCLQNPLDPPRVLNDKTNPVAQTNLLIARKTRSSIKSIAELIFSSYVSQHPKLNKKSWPFVTSPLLNFTHFIISIIDSGHSEAATFRVLCDLYRITWARDPNYVSYLTRIGFLYFGINDQTKQRQGGFFNNILSSLLEGADEDEEDQSQVARTSFSSCDELD